MATKEFEYSSSQKEMMNPNPENPSRTKFYVAITLILLVAIFFVGKSALQLYRDKTQVVQQASENMVTLTDKGFAPDSLAIKAGTAVRWQNKSGASASVNSDNFPTNKLFPELNLGKFERNQTLVHVFTKPGKYTYHNQMRPQNTGTIIVK